jgi:hypothetical protein
MKVLFAGPSLHHDLVYLRRHQSDVAWHGPARCGDIMRAARGGATAIALIDGLFDQDAAPWHKEILYALSQGISVAGGASMGALRAAECSAFGMIGIGEVYRRYATGEVTDDSDVAQLHAPAELNYLPLTEPWVNIEPTLRRMEQQGVLRREAIEALIDTARYIHYTERTYPEIVRLTEELTEDEATTALQWLRDHAVDQKRLDALAVLEWLRSQADVPAIRELPWQLQETTQWMELLRTLDEGA